MPTNKNSHLHEIALTLALAQGSATIVVRQDCMSPAICRGARVVVAPCVTADLAAGEVVLLTREGRLILHRYLGRWQQNGQEYLLCKADRHYRPDRPWEQAALVGRVVHVNDSAPEDWQADALGVLWRSGLAAATRFGIACGLLDDLPPQTSVETLRLRGEENRETLRCLFDAGKETEVENLRAGLLVDETSTAALPEHPTVTITVRILTALPTLTPGVRTEHGERRLITDKVIVRMPLDAGHSEVLATDAAGALAGVEAICRSRAISSGIERGGITLHAASAVDHAGELYVFAGASGAGKTTAALTFGASQQRDRDIVCLRPVANSPTTTPCEFRRVCILPFPQAGVAPEELTASLPIKTILLPQHKREGKHAGEVCLTKLTGSNAVRACLHLPPDVLTTAQTAAALANVAELIERVPVYRLAWAKGDDLPEALRKHFG